MKFNRYYKLLIMLLLALSVSVLALTFVVAADESDELQEEQTEVTEEISEDVNGGEEIEDEEGEETFDYLTNSFGSPEEKLATMSLYSENDDYAIYGLEETGEVGVLVKSTGQILLTNPYDVASTSSSKAVKEQLLSQIILTYSDMTGTTVSLNSFADAAFASEDTKQIHMSKTRNGLRVEYTIGREAVKYIVPRQIEKSAFEEKILAYLEEGSRPYRKVEAYYELKDISDASQSQALIDAIKYKWPITEKYAIYVLDSEVGNRELAELEGYIKGTYFDEYAKVEEMYEMLDYVDTTAAPALFRFAIEYTLDEHGLEIRLPASSIRYDSSNYTLKSVKFLPYFCAGNNKNNGFTLVPDGSGAITRFEDIADRAFTFTGKLYGKDYSFHSISGTTQETMRFPAFGVMTTPVEKTDEEVYYNSDNNEQEQSEEVIPVVSSGFVAYLEEGDAMAEVTADHGGTVHPYSSVYTTFYPKPSDSYILEGLSSAGDVTFGVSTDRRYTGNYTLRIFPVSGVGCNYADMATEVRKYLVNTDVLNKLDKNTETSEDIPLYLETFGSIDTSAKVLGFPVTVQTPLTRFSDVKDMVTELKASGVNNINVKMTGWNNGGMSFTAPSKLKVEKVLGGKKGLIELIEYAKQNNVGIYPDLNFVYVFNMSNFDKFDYKEDSVKTIDNRSAVYRTYNPLYQGFDDRGSLIISPTSALKFYNNIKDEFAEYGTPNISVATLGSELSSDHNEDYALNREEVKQVVTNILSDIDNNHESVMVSGGNAYTLGYVDHVLEVPLDSSRNINTSEAVPFVGMVLHGNVEFAGTAINLDGDYEYSVLKAIENGAGLYFILSKDNTSELKQYERFSKYYAIGYDIWKEDLISTYNMFNDAMKKVKYSYITEHETLDTRVVRVGYDNGVEFILNYNTHPVEIDGITVEALGFVER